MTIDSNTPDAAMTLPPRAPTRRPWSGGEIAAWGVIVFMVALIAWMAVAVQIQTATAERPNGDLPLMAKNILSAHMLSGSSKDTTGNDRQMLTQLENMANTAEDRFRVAVVAGEFFGAEQALRRMDTLAQEDTELAEDVETAKALYHGDSVPEKTWSVFHKKYEWFADLLAGTGKPASDPQRMQALRQAYLTMAIYAGCLLAAAVLTLTGLVLLIIAIVLLVRRKLPLAFVRSEMPGAEPADRRTYLYGMALYLSGSFILGLGLQIIRSLMGVKWSVGLYLQGAAFLAGLILPLLLGQTGRQWRQALGLHRGRGVWREIGSGVVGYLAGLPLVAVGMILVMFLTNMSGIKGSHPITQDVQLGSQWELVWVFFLACVFAPVTEELMFRGALFAHLRERFGWWTAAPAMALVFALVHPQSWVALPALGAIAVVLAGIREWRGSIIGCITAHALHNGLTLTVAVLLLR